MNHDATVEGWFHYFNGLDEAEMQDVMYSSKLILSWVKDLLGQNRQYLHACHESAPAL